MEIARLSIMGKYKDLEVWKDAIELAVCIHKLLKGEEFRHDYILRDQMRRSTISIPSNIAEGDEVRSLKHSIHYFQIAKGSLAELETQLFLSKEFNYLSKDQYDIISQRTDMLSRKLRKLIQYRSSRLND